MTLLLSAMLAMLTLAYGVCLFLPLKLSALLKNVAAMVLMLSWLLLTKLSFQPSVYLYIMIGLVFVGVAVISNTIYDQSQAKLERAEDVGGDSASSSS